LGIIVFSNFFEIVFSSLSKMGQSTSSLGLKNLSDFACLTPEGSAPAIFLTKNPYPNPCQLSNSSIVTLANQMKEKDGTSGFLLGVGPCPQCEHPTLYHWSRNQWRTKSYDLKSQERMDKPRHTKVDASHKRSAKLLDDIIRYLKKNEINYVYLLLVDGNLHIQNTLRMYQVKGDTLESMGTCAVPSGVPAQYQQTSSSSGMIILIIIIIILLVLLIWYLSKR